ncbi:MAG: adenylosuccinate lyase, partial [Nitrososphaera sp.]
MPILPIDSGRYGSAEMRRIFDDERRLQYQLEFEAAVARAQSKMGIIPADVAREIGRAGRSGKVSLARVAELEAASEHD